MDCAVIAMERSLIPENILPVFWPGHSPYVSPCLVRNLSRCLFSMSRHDMSIEAQSAAQPVMIHIRIGQMDWTQTYLDTFYG